MGKYPADCLSNCLHIVLSYNYKVIHSEDVGRTQMLLVLRLRNEALETSVQEGYVMSND